MSESLRDEFREFLTHHPAGDDQGEWIERAKEAGELIHFAETMAVRRSDNQTSPWAACDRAAQLPPDLDKWVMTGAEGLGEVTCEACLISLVHSSGDLTVNAALRLGHLNIERYHPSLLTKLEP